MKICPCCGYDLIANQPVILNDFAMAGPLGGLFYQGTLIKLTGIEKEICWSLMRAYPEPVLNTVLLERAGSDGIPENVKVHVHHIRRKLELIGAPDPIENCHLRAGGGYKWRLCGS